MDSSDEVSECRRPITVRSERREAFERSRIRRYAEPRFGLRTLYWRPVIRPHRTARAAPLLKIGKPPYLRALLRRAVSGLRSVRPNGRQNIVARGGSMSRKRAESHCTREIGH